jgi:hypothetical protein
MGDHEKLFQDWKKTLTPEDSIRALDNFFQHCQQEKIVTPPTTVMQGDTRGLPPKIPPAFAKKSNTPLEPYIDYSGNFPKTVNPLEPHWTFGDNPRLITPLKPGPKISGPA